MRNRILHIGLLIGILLTGTVGFGQITITAPGSVCAGAEFTITVRSSYKIYYELEEKISSSSVWTTKGRFQTNGSGSTYTNTNYRPFIFETTRYRIKYTTDNQFVSPTPVLLPQDAEVTLFTTPIVANITLSPAACGGSIFNVNPSTVSGNVIPVGTVYSWTIPSVTGGLVGGAAGNNSGTIFGTLTNPTNITQSATYTVTPRTNEGCTGTDFIATIPVNPTPSILPKETSICSGGTFSVTITDNSPTQIVPAGTTYTWLAPTLTGAVGAVTGGTSGAGSNVTGTLTNNTNAVQTATYSVTPTSADGCQGATFTVTVTVKPKPNIPNNNPPAICTGTSFVFTPTGIVPLNTQYTWTVTDNPDVEGESNVFTPTASFSQQLTNRGIDQEIVNYVVTPISDGCAGPSFNSSVTLIPNPQITTPILGTVCSGSSFIFTPENNRDGIVPANTRYTWTILPNPNVTGQTEQSTQQVSIRGANLINNTLNEEDLTYNVTSSISNGCATTTFQLIVKVVPVAQINNKNLVPICSGTSLTVIPGPFYQDVVVPGTTYTWSFVDNPNVTGETGVYSPTSVNRITQVLTNTTNTLQSVVYNVTSVATTCAAASFTIIANILPRPSITEKTAQTCTGDRFEVIPTNGGSNIVPANTRYRWNAPVVTGGLTGGTSATAAATISGTLTNPTNSVQTATYSVTPISVEGCEGGTFTVTVSVNPKATIQNKVPPTICSGESFTVTPTDGSGDIVPVGTTYTWSVALNTNVTGQSASSTLSNTSISQQLTNTTNEVQTVTYTVTPKSGDCEGGIFIVTVTVNPKPSIQAKVPAAICSGDSFTVTPTNGSGDIVPAGTTYTWTVATNSNVTGQSASSTASITTISQQLTNTTNLIQTLFYTVTPKSGDCVGGTFMITITVNPKPSIQAKVPAAICSGDSFTVTPTNGSGDIAPVGTTYTWNVIENTSVTGETPSSTLSVTTISQQLTNTTNEVQTVVYTVTPKLGDCVGGTFTITVTVNPKPSIQAKVPAAICSGDSFTVTPTNGSGDIVPAGTTYTWTVATNLNVTGQAASSTASITTISQQLTNTTNVVQIVTYTVTPKSGNCVGGTFSITITVNPKATIATKILDPVCSGFPFTFTPLGSDIVPIGTTYTWNTPTVTGGMTGGTSATNAATISGTLTNPTNTQQTALYLITPNSGNCPGGTFTVTARINALPYSPTTTPVVVPYDKQLHGFNVTTTPSNASNEILRWYATPEAFSTISPTYTLARPTPYTILVSSYNTVTQCESAEKVTASLTISAKEIDAQATALSKVYDRTTTATASVTSNQVIAPDVVTFAHTGANFDTRQVGTNKLVTLTGVTINGGADASNYTLKATSNTLTSTASITVKPITVTATATDRVYNATASATVTLTSPGIISPDEVLFAHSPASFNNKTANVGKQVTVTGISISGGADAGNYTLTSTTANATGTISKSEITITGASVSNKIYDGTSTASITGGTITASVLLSDVVTLTLIGNFNDRNVGINKPITSTSTIGGADAANYYVTQPTGLTATISKKNIREENPVTQNKVYDATIKVVNYTAALKAKQAPGAGTTADLTPYTIDDISITPTATFATKDVGNSISISSTSVLAGVDKGNYELINATTLSPKNITEKTIKMTGLIIPASKVYDGLPTAVITDNKSFLTASLPGEGTASDGKPYTIDIPNLDFTGAAIGTYNTKNVLTANTVTYTGLVLSGTESGNYSLTIQEPQPATIVPKQLTMSGLSVPQTKVYDAKTNAVVDENKRLQTKIPTGTGTKDDGKPYLPDDVLIAGTPIATYNSKDVLTASTVAYSGLSLSGVDASNYALKIQEPSNASIVPLERSVVAIQLKKIYGEEDPIFTYTSDPLLESDVFNGVLSRASGKNVGSYPIEIGTLSAGPNYTINFTSKDFLIDKALIFITANNAKRVYGDAPLATKTNSKEFIAEGLKYDEKVGFVTISYNNEPGFGNKINDSVGNYPGSVNAINASGGTFNVLNYKFVFFRGDISVEKLPIIITAESKEKREGEIDPPLTFLKTVSLVPGDSFTGNLLREQGETTGAYQIKINTLALNNNYAITFRPGIFTIKPEEPTFVIPKAFTPNGDGRNDELKIIQDGIKSINYYQIFSRSGKLVFQTKDLSEGWDGRMNGIMLDSDVYYWNVEFITWNNKPIKISGSVILIK